MIMPIDAYEERIIAFADIIGWKDAVTDLSQYDLLKETEQLIEGRARGFSEEMKQTLKNAPGVSEACIQEHASIEFSFFSDCFAVSAPADNEKNIKLIFKIMSFTSHDLLYKKFLLRGGVTIGKLYHKQGIIFGPAMNEAVELEKEEPHYPCLLCSEELGRYLKQTDYMDKVVLKDKYQKLVVNIACIGSPNAKRDLMTIIEREFSEAKKFAGKWQYLQDMLPKMYEMLVTG